MIAWELFCGCCGDDDYGFYYSDDCVGIFTMMVVFLIVMIVVFLIVMIVVVVNLFFICLIEDFGCNFFIMVA